MHSPGNIRALVYPLDDADGRICRAFLSLEGKQQIPYVDESELPGILGELRARGLASKEVVVLKKFRGRIFQKCPGSKNVICCNYHLLNICFDCLFDCTYCFLNSYLNSYGIVQFTNIFELMDELEETIAGKGSGTVMRMGTGEFTDSLMMDAITGIGVDFIGRFSKYRNIFLELKTKSSAIDHLLAPGPRGNAVLAWSLNTPANITLYESGTAGLSERIGAAEKAVKAGYLTAFHLDPLILNGRCVDEYLTVIDEVLARVGRENIIWISMGCFRHGPGFREVLRERFPREMLTTGEMFPGPDGKYRYLKERRIEAYRALRERIQGPGRGPFLYLCMETGDVWELSMERTYAGSEELERDLAAHCGEFIRNR